MNLRAREAKRIAVKIKGDPKPTETAVLNIVGKGTSKPKYAVNVIFDGDMEGAIKERAKELGMGVATYIKMLVSKDLKER